MFEVWIHREKKMFIKSEPSSKANDHEKKVFLSKKKMGILFLFPMNYGCYNHRCKIIFADSNFIVLLIVNMNSILKVKSVIIIVLQKVLQSKPTNKPLVSIYCNKKITYKHIFNQNNKH